MAEKKKGDYRVLEGVEITKDYGMYKVGQKIEAHPKLVKMLIDLDVAKRVTKKTK